MNRERVSVFTLLLMLIAGVGLAVEQPVAVSPGNASKISLSEDRCPTFSWGIVEGAKSYDLIVYRLGDERDQAEPVLQQGFVGSVNGWTPSLDRCLERGGRYAWSVRAVGRRGESEWSIPSLFRVAVGPSEMEFESAFQVMRSYLETKVTKDMGVVVENATPARDGVSAVPRAGSAASTGASALLDMGGDSALQVNGAPVVTTATFQGALCALTHLRFLDQGDGTVRDCNTGTIWLKDASCDALGPNGDGTARWTQAEAAAAALSSGECGLTDDSLPGDWRQATASEFCSVWSGSILSPCPSTAASNSLVDSSVGPPAVVNATGDGTWFEKDAFLDVQSDTYWSGSEEDGSLSWGVVLTDGNVTFFSKLNAFFLWPVRGGP